MSSNIERFGEPVQGIRTRLTYANVIATLALFLALSGGVVYAAETIGKNAVKSKNIAANAVKTRNLAKNSVKNKNLAANAVKAKNLAKESVTAAKVKTGSLTRADLSPTTLAGLQVADVQAAAIPNFGVENTRGTPIPLTGTGIFTPLPGKSYELLLEVKGNPVAVPGSEPGYAYCSAGVSMLSNGHPLAFASVSANTSPPPFNVEPIGGTSVPIGLLEPGQPQTLTAVTSWSEGCSPGMSGSLRAVVVQFG
jgi:hypothetical protein